MYLTTKYLQSRQLSFWIWEDDGEVVSISGGKTISYTRPMFELLQSASLKHLPRFGAFLAVLAVLSPDGVDSKMQILLFLEEKEILNKSNRLSVSRFLDTLTDLSPELKHPKRLSLLIRCVFEQTHGQLSEKVSKRIMQATKGLARAPMQSQEIAIQTSQELQRDMRTLEILHRRFPSVKAIVEAMAGMVEIEEQPEDLWRQENSGEGSELTWLQQLQNNSQTFPVASLISHLWAGFNIPWYFNRTGEQPLGGVADVANKGSFDRLLLTEFANDDLLFMSRLANSEALYYSREVPPNNQKHKRIIIIDVSITNWGIVKTLSFSTALALLNHPKSDCEYEVYAIGENYRKLDLTTLESVIASIQHLELCLHSAGGLALLCKDVLTTKSKVFYIGGQGAFAQPEMVHVIAVHRKLFNYWIHPTASGEVSIYLNKLKDRKHLKSILVPYEKLWKQKKAKLPVIKSHYDRKMPLLLPGMVGYHFMIYGQNDHFTTLFMMTKDGALLQKNIKDDLHNRTGWQLITSKLSIRGGVFAIAKKNDGEFWLLNYAPAKKRVTEVNLRTMRKTDFLLDLEGLKNSEQIVFCNDGFYYKNVGKAIRIKDKKQFQDHDNDCSKKVGDLFQVLKDSHKTLQKQKPKGFSTLKNIVHVCVTKGGVLAFNGHQLTINDGGHIKLKKTNPLNRVLEATQDGAQFRFEDGSYVVVHSYGILELVSSDDTIPTIFLPTTLGRALGVASGKHFAGDYFYYREAVSRLTLKKGGAKLLEVVKLVKKYSHMGLKDCKELIDRAPCELPPIRTQKADQLIKAVNDLPGAEMKFEEREDPLEIIETKRFYLKYIQAFIDEIVI